MEGYCSTGQSPQWAVVPMEEEDLFRDTHSDLPKFPRSPQIPVSGFSNSMYRGADKSLARPTSRCILFDRIFRLMLVLLYI